MREIIEIEYDVSQPLTAKTWYAKIDTEEFEFLHQLLKGWLHDCCEGLSHNEDFDIVLQKSRKDFGVNRDRQWNTLLGVLSGVVAKMEVGDLSAKQVEHVEAISTVLSHLGEEGCKFGTQPCEIKLRRRLFDHL